jgi:hypothetical protein
LRCGRAAVQLVLNLVPVELAFRSLDEAVDGRGIIPMSSLIGIPCGQVRVARRPGLRPGQIAVPVAPNVRRSARLARHPRRAGVRHGAAQALPGDGLAVARTGAAARAVSSGLRRAGRLRAPAPHLAHEHRRDLGGGGQDQRRLTARISGKSRPWNGSSSTAHTGGGARGTRPSRKSIVPGLEKDQQAGGEAHNGAGEAPDRQPAGNQL